jgi:eukaryotic-like serine/threonine-protein kinase
VASRLGEYELLFELASGGMATLYVARHAGVANVERLVAVKRVHRDVLAVPGVETMFRDEARLAALIRHPNVVRVLDVAEVGGELLIVLDYIDSVSLAALLAAARATGERLPLPIIVRVIADALAGLHAAHEATNLHGEPLHIVHRDFSPQNVVVGVDGTSHLIDFGVAKAAMRSTKTGSGLLKGKLQYMSPEQARGADIDRRSDVFSAGIVLFEAITGALPFAADTDPSAILLRIMLDPVPPVSSLANGILTSLDAVVERALERVRDERYQSAKELHDALVAAVPPASTADVQAAVEHWCHEPIAARRAKLQAALAGTAPTLVVTPAADTILAPASAAPPSAQPKPRSRRGRGRVAVVVAAVAIAAIGGVIWHGHADAPSTRVVVDSAPAELQPRPVTPTPTSDGALILRDHRVRAVPKLISNTTAVANPVIERALADLASYVLVSYHAAVGERPLPAGTVTVVYELDHRSFTSTLDDDKVSKAVASALMVAFDRVLVTAPRNVTGRIVLAVDIAVQ